MEAQNKRLLFIHENAHRIHDVTLTLERLVVEADEMYRLTPEEVNTINGISWTVFLLFNWIREQLQLIMAAADGKDIANLKEGGEKVA